MGGLSMNAGTEDRDAALRGISSWYLSALIMTALPLLLSIPSFAAAQDNPTGFEDIAHRAAAAREAGDSARAIQLYQEAERLNPKWPDGWFFLGSLHYGTDSYAAARDALTHYIDLTQNATAAFALRGLCEFELGEYPQSLLDIQRGLALGAANQPRNEQILRYHEALLLTRLGRYEDALQSYGFFARRGVSSPEILFGLGLAGLRVPLLPKDVATDRQELFMVTGNAAYLSLAGNDEKAQQAFLNLFQRFPAEANAHYLYGYLLFAKDPDQAVTEFKRASEMAPSSASAQAMLAWSSLVRNESLDAVPYAERAVENDPSLALAQLVLGRSLVETGDVKNGIDHLQRALQLEPNNLEVHLALARGYSEAGRPEDARRERLICLQVTEDEANQIAH
jgi:tetratricopeptide (TPR) repeat protein